MDRPDQVTPPSRTEETTWLASHLLRRQVVDVDSVAPAGRVVDLIFDPDTFLVMGLIIESSERGRVSALGRLFKRRNSVAYVGLDHVIAMDGDVVTLNTNPFNLAQSRDMERLPRLNATCEMAILTTRGTCLGTLADLLLDDRGTVISGYVVSPTAAGEETLPAFTDLSIVQPGGTDRRMRIIPADSPLRIGESLIMLLGEVAPLREFVVVTPQPVIESAAGA
jgi:sporulation protein YlmC with PRC-barrel domain